VNLERAEYGNLERVTPVVPDVRKCAEFGNLERAEFVNLECVKFGSLEYAESVNLEEGY
jgi:hypothetical protein